MPVLHVTQPQSNIKQFFLPSTADKPEAEQAWIKIDVGPESVADMQAMTDEDNNSMMRTSRIVVNRIKEWNFVDENDKPVPISFETFWFLQPEDRIYILTLEWEDSAVKPLSDQEKKT